MNKQVIIIGSGKYSAVIKELIEANNDIVYGYLDDNATNVLGKTNDYIKYLDYEFIVSIGDLQIREKFSKFKCKWYTAIHPTAYISPSATIGEGTLVLPNALICADAKIGKHCIINHMSFVGHHNKIDNFVHLSVGAKLGGTVNIGKSTWVGIGSTVKNNINICDNCIIGAGAVVVKDINIPGTYVGVPAKIL